MDSLNHDEPFWLLLGSKKFILFNRLKRFGEAYKKWRLVSVGCLSVAWDVYYTFPPAEVLTKCLAVLVIGFYPNRFVGRKERFEGDFAFH